MGVRDQGFHHAATLHRGGDYERDLPPAYIERRYRRALARIRAAQMFTLEPHARRMGSHEAIQRLLTPGIER